METIVAWRGEESEDEYGNPVQGDLEPWRDFPALVAPNHPVEPAQVGRNAVITGYTMFIETGEPTGILDTDMIEVRSPVPLTAPVAERRRHLLPVDGVVASWYRRNGAYRGDQLAVKVVEG